MAYVQVATRSSSNVNASADINQLQKNIEALKGGDPAVAPTTDIETLAAAGGGGGGEPNPFWVAGDFIYPTSNPAPLDTDVGSNITIKRQLFDDTTNWSLLQKFQVPSNVDTAGTATFILWGYPSTGAANDVVFRYGHSPIATAENWDVAYTNEDSGALTCQATQDFISRFTWTETISNMGWAANDFIFNKIERLASDVSDTLVGHFGLVAFGILIPRS